MKIAATVAMTAFLLLLVPFAAAIVLGGIVALWDFLDDVVKGMLDG